MNAAKETLHSTDVPERWLMITPNERKNFIDWFIPALNWV